MKKFLLLMMALVVACTTAWAIPAKPGVHIVTQPDGSTIHLLLIGDEWHHSFITADGYTVQQADDGFFYYITTDGLSKTIAHDGVDRDEAEIRFVNVNKEKMTLQALYATKVQNGLLRSRTKGIGIKAAEVPTSGSPKIPVLLIQYSNVSMKHTKAEFEAHYNTQTWSVLKYFTDQSNGLFTPQFDIYGIYTLNNNRSYYGANSGGDDVRVGQMVSDAISKAGNAIDWSQYDNDGDGYVDACIVVYAGPGEASGAAAETIWPCQWYLSSAIGNYVTRNNTKIDKFAVFCELSGSSDSGTTLDGIGTFCHEFSHCLGLPDFYPTDYSNHFGMGSWSVMHAGCDNNNGNRPCSYTAYERNFMGWMNLSTPTEGQTYTIATVDAGGPAYKITSNNANEYYILENIQKTGWNQYAPASGLMVNHVNYNATRWNYGYPNDYDAQGMTIIPADNSLKVDYLGNNQYYYNYNDQVGDLYPYNGNNQLTSTSTPAATLYNSSTNLNKPITNITKNSNNTVSFTYMGAPAQDEETGGTASDAYLNIAKYNTIDAAGLNVTAQGYVNKLYKYTEYPDDKCAWLTMSVFGAWAGCRYPQSGGQNAGPQKWITSNVTSGVGTSATTAMGTGTWNSNDIFLGSSEYFTTATSRFFGTGRTQTSQNSTERTITFQVTNVTGIKLTGMNNNVNLNNYPTRLQVYECSKNADGTLTQISSTPVSGGNLSSTSQNTAVNFSVTNLDPTKYYKIVARTTRARFYEIGFKTPLKTLPGVPINVEADPGSTTADITWTPGSDNEDWNLRYREYVEDAGSGSGESTLWDLTLDNYQTQIADFSIYDGDGDGDNWGLVYSNEQQTDVCFASWSYDPDTESDLTPDNWLFTPEVELGGTLKFKSALRLTGWPDKLGVYVLPTDDENYYKLGDIVPDAVFPSFGEYEFDLSNFEGMGQIAFRHYESDGNVAILLDDIEVITAGATEGPWIYVYSEESPYTITGLTPETTYEVQVQGVNGDGVSDWTASTIFTTLALEEAVEATLAQIESTGLDGGVVGQSYTISDDLVAVDYRLIENDVYLWCKDLGHSNNPTNPVGDQIDFMRNADMTGPAQAGDWDQSNWVVLKLTGQSGASKADEVKGYIITGGSITGKYVDNGNYMIEVTDNGAGFVKGASADYTLNVYCTSNFVEANLGQPGAQTGLNEPYYFFMNPKVQEICHITFARWDGTKFVVPTNSGFPGEISSLNWNYNTNASGTPVPFADVELVKDEIYEFDAIVTTASVSGAPMLKAGGSGYAVAPMNLTGGGNIITAINGVYTDGYRGNVVGVEYVNSVGQVSSTPFKGINIVVTRYSNGSSTSVKKVFK